MNIDQAVAKYIELRDRKAALKKEMDETLAPIDQAMETIQNWLLDQLNKNGVKTMKSEHGTFYKLPQTSVSIADADVFKDYVFRPAAEAIGKVLAASGYPFTDAEIGSLVSIMKTSAKWAVVDFRAGKKGVQEAMEEGEAVPGVNATQTMTVGVRRS